MDEEAAMTDRPPGSNPGSVISIDDLLNTSNSVRSKPRLFLLYTVIVLQFVIFVTELITDQFLHSLLILTDSYHHLFNTCNGILLVLTFKISNQVTLKNTFGWVRIEILGMLTTITFIVALIFSLLIEGCLQLFHLHEMSGPTSFRILFYYGACSLATNIFYVFVIHWIEKNYHETTKPERTFSIAKCEPKPETSGTEISDQIPLKPIESTNDNSNPNNNNNDNQMETEESTVIGNNCLLVSLAKGLSSPTLLIFCSAMIILFEQSNLVEMLDPLVGIISAILLCVSFYPQLKSTMFILLQTMPENVDIVLMKRDILDKFQMIQSIHEFHIWRLTTSKVVATLHLVLPIQSTTEYHRFFTRIQKYLQSRYGIFYITIQPEFRIGDIDLMAAAVVASEENKRDSADCLMKCPSRNGHTFDDCDKMTCCASQDQPHDHSEQVP